GLVLGEALAAVDVELRIEPGLLCRDLVGEQHPGARQRAAAGVEQQLRVVARAAEAIALGNELVGGHERHPMTAPADEPAERAQPGGPLPHQVPQPPNEARLHGRAAPLLPGYLRLEVGDAPRLPGRRLAQTIDRLPELSERGVARGEPLLERADRLVLARRLARDCRGLRLAGLVCPGEVEAEASVPVA